MNIDLTGTRSKLLQLNSTLKKKCKGVLSISIYSGVELTSDIVNMSYDKNSQMDFIICLNYRRECISSISCKINLENHYIEFSSKTQEIYEGNKYNLLLRSALILLVPYIKYNDNQSINSIISRAINPISIYLMVKYFYAVNDKLTSYMNENNLTNDTLKYNNAEEFYNNVDLEDEIDDEDEETMAMRLKNDKTFGEPIKLTIDLTDETYIKRANEIFNNVAINCPKIQVDNFISEDPVVSDVSNRRILRVRRGGTKKCKGHNSSRRGKRNKHTKRRVKRVN